MRRDAKEREKERERLRLRLALFSASSGAVLPVLSRKSNERRKCQTLINCVEKVSENQMELIVDCLRFRCWHRTNRRTERRKGICLEVRVRRKRASPFWSTGDDIFVNSKVYIKRENQYLNESALGDVLELRSFLFLGMGPNLGTVPYHSYIDANTHTQIHTERKSSTSSPGFVVVRT